MRPMQTPAVLLSAIIAATCTAVAVTWVANRSTALPDADAGTDAGLERRIAGVEAKLGDLVQRLERINADTASAIGRTVAAPTIDIEAAVAKILAARKVTEAGATVANAGLTKEQALSQLAEVGSNYEQLQKLWPQIEKAGLEEEVLAQYAALAETSPSDAKAQYQYGAMLIAGIQTKPPAKQAALAMKADAAFDKALKVDDKHWAARFMKATSLSFWPKITGKQGEAVRHFEVLVEQQEQGKPQPHFAETYHFLGNLYQDAGNQAKAKTAYERGLRWFPDNENLKRQLATLKKDG